MKHLRILFMLVTVYSVTGCSMVGCDRVFPHMTWYWSSEAKRCRESREQEKAYKKVGEQQAKEWGPESTNRVTNPK